MERFSAREWDSGSVRIYDPVSTLKYEDIRIWIYRDSVEDIWKDFESSFESFIPSIDLQEFNFNNLHCLLDIRHKR